MEEKMTHNAANDLYVSTILENLFQYFDEGLCSKKPQYRSLNKLMRLKAALIVFNETGLAQREENGDPPPIMVPTRELMEMLQASLITTSLEPLAIPLIAMSKQDIKKYFRYSQDLGRRLHELADCLEILRPALFAIEVGWVEHVRDEDGTLRWSITTAGAENIENGTVARLALSDEPFGRNYPLATCLSLRRGLLLRLSLVSGSAGDGREYFRN
jgi:hypothetical protein